MFKVFLSAICSLLCVGGVLAQTSGTMVMDKGLKYVVAFAPVTPAVSEKPLPNPLHLCITTSQNATVRIQASAEGLLSVDKTVSITVPTGAKSATYLYSVGTAWLPQLAQVKKRLAFTVTSDVPISVYTRESWQGNGEESSFLPVTALGTDYVVVSSPTDRYGTSSMGYKDRPGFAMIIATQDETRVSITPTVRTEGGLDLHSITAGTTGLVDMMANEVLLIKNVIDSTTIRNSKSDLTGTKITSNKPIVVISGHTKSSVINMPNVLPPTGIFATQAHFVRNNLHEMLLPNNLAGQEFVFATIPYTASRNTIGALPQYGMGSDKGDVVRFMALTDGTVIYKRDSAGNINSVLATLNRGDYFTDSSSTFSCVYQTSHPALAYQYGKGYAKIVPQATNKGVDQIQGHPTVVAGMPCLQALPSVARWISNTAFSAVDGMDNYVRITYKTADSAQLYLDGFSLASGRYKTFEIANTPYSVLRSSIAAGEHSITSTSDTVRFMVYYNASLDGLQMGRAMGRAIGVNAAVVGSDTISLVEGLMAVDTSACGSAEGKVVIAGTTGLSMIYSSANSNYSLSVEEFEQGALEAAYSVAVLDGFKPANVTVRVVARSGVYVERSYSYTPKLLSVQNVPASVHTSPRAEVCLEARLKNSTDGAISCHNFTSNDARFEVTTQMPLPISIQVGEELTVPICVKTDVKGVSTIQVNTQLDCVEQLIGEVKVNVFDAYLVTTDAQFGVVHPNSGVVTLPVSIENPSPNPVLIDSLGLAEFNAQKYFSFDPSTPPVFSGVLQTGERQTFLINYNPKGDSGTHTARIIVHSNAVSQDSVILCQATSTVSSSVFEVEDYTSAVVPNPVSVSGSCTVAVPVGVSLRIVDIRGRTVFEIQEQPSSELVVKPSSMGMTAGTYFVVSSGRISQTIARIVVQ